MSNSSKVIKLWLYMFVAQHKVIEMSEGIAVSNSTSSETLTLNDIVRSVMNDEMRRKTIGDATSSSIALSMKSRGRQNNKQNNMGRSPTRGRSKSRGKSKSKVKIIVCWNCNKEGHKKNDCIGRRKREQRKNKVMMKGKHDHASRKTWIYDISQKSNVYHTFKKRKHYKKLPI
ncbi:hypothetical protein RJ639_015024 [Escallonia herrerae]|uniref:CCHC-type domain-containing protein n=1 Tax=Escallonia herrerae TaxID=1293975 RepID=A0AA88VFJ0_9ASTE|nr:hypothetical protein RJ639_015024 [Escallonia herrerae]